MSPAAFATGHRRPVRHLITLLLLASSLLALVACTSSPPAPTPPPKPTATQGSAKPASSPAAKASPAVGASPMASPSPSPSPQAALQILDATLADATPWVSLRLDDGEPLIVSGWRLEVGDQSIVVPGNAIIQPGDTLTLWASEGLSSEREIYLGPESYPLALAAKPGTRVRLIDPTGMVAAETTVPRF